MTNKILTESIRSKTNMPKQLFTPIQLPPEQPPCCAACPLVGIIPQCERPKGSKETHVCLATGEALAGRGIVSQHDRHRRPCDDLWDSWPRKYGIRRDYYLRYRVPYDQSKQMVIKFHDKRGPKPAN